MADAGIIPQAGNAREYDVSGWRSEHPVRDAECCIQCLFCWVYCPDSSVIIKDEKVVAFDPVHCKGCGICAQVCPKQCITMEPGGEMPQE
ncbi:MAG: 4Fe-4S binding protein [candidate division WS1 bacterium]|nr:4Fe-4S binding protein [candidate division WS1 bacterium]